jgi:uncharacterized protein YbaP (TraB family)
MIMMAALSKAMLTDGRTLDQVVAPEVYAEVKKRAEKTGLPMVALQRMKPWLVAITLMAPTLQGGGIQTRARDRSALLRSRQGLGHERQALETMRFNSIIRHSVSEIQEELLKSTNGGPGFREVGGCEGVGAGCGRAGNVAAIEKLTLASLQEA